METITLKDFLLCEDQKIADAARRREASRIAALQKKDFSLREELRYSRAIHRREAELEAEENKEALRKMDKVILDKKSS